MKKFIIKETKESFDSIHELRQHALIEQIKDYTLIVMDDKQMTEGIRWSNCAYRMPPNDVDFKLIVKTQDGVFVADGYAVHEWREEAVPKQHIWTEYTPEKWEELNK